MCANKIIVFTVFLLIAMFSNAIDTGVDFEEISLNCPKLDFGKEGNDVRSSSPKTLKLLNLVEGAHFTRSVRAGVGGNTGSLYGDLDYVLRRFPNHAHALTVMASHQMSPDFTLNNPLRRDKKKTPLYCYFKRVTTLFPDDYVALLAVAVFYHKYDNEVTAEKYYLRSLELNDQSAETHYNIGLLYANQGQLMLAKKHAEVAYGLGFPLGGLRKVLLNKGVALN